MFFFIADKQALSGDRFNDDKGTVMTAMFKMVTNFCTAFEELMQ